MDILVNGIPLVPIIIALVEWTKELGLEGKALRVVSMVLGILFGIGYQFSVKPPVDFAGWFAAGIQGLALGLTASGLYDVGKSLRAK